MASNEPSLDPQPIVNTPQITPTQPVDWQPAPDIKLKFRHRPLKLQLIAAILVITIPLAAAALFLLHNQKANPSLQASANNQAKTKATTSATTTPTQKPAVSAAAATPTAPTAPTKSAAPSPSSDKKPPPITKSVDNDTPQHTFVPPPPSTGGLCYQVSGSATRSTSDQADDNSGYQLHFIYALPSDGTDNAYDTNGAIARSVSAWQNWMCNQTGGKKMQVDTHNGTLDISFVRFSANDNTIKTGSDLPWSTDPNNNPYIRDDLEIYLKALGFNDPHKLYAVYYDGTSNHSCGGGAWPPTLPGHVAAEYMHGGDPNYPDCGTNHLATDVAKPGYLDFDIIHEVMHTLGFVATCAPNHVLSGHASDSNTDLMYAGNQPWAPSVLDFNHNDYYNTGSSSCLDLANSAFFTGGGSQLPPRW